MEGRNITLRVNSTTEHMWLNNNFCVLFPEKHTEIQDYFSLLCRNGDTTIKYYGIGFGSTKIKACVNLNVVPTGRFVIWEVGVK